jgi:hypothetical protein
MEPRRELPNSHNARRLASIPRIVSILSKSGISTALGLKGNAGGRVAVPLIRRIDHSLLHLNYSCMEKGKLRPAIELITLADRLPQCPSSTRPALSKWLS